MDIWLIVYHRNLCIKKFQEALSIKKFPSSFSGLVIVAITTVFQFGERFGNFFHFVQHGS